MQSLVCCVVVCVVMCLTAAAHDTNMDDEDEDLDQLYQYRAPEQLIDPFDMLSYPRHEPLKVDSGVQKVGEQRTGSVTENDEVNSDMMMECEARVLKLQENIEAEKQRSSLLLKKLNDEGTIDMTSFYRRLIHHLWNVMELEEAWDVLKDDNVALVRRLGVRVTRRDLDTLHDYLHHQQHLHQVDEFVTNSFTLEKIPESAEGNLFRTLLTTTMSFLEVGKNIEVWLYLMCGGFLVLAGWAVLLFVRDIQRELRWGRVMVMMAIVVFFICCLWHWRHLVKKAESERHAKMMQRGFEEIPEECKPGAQGAAGSVFKWIKDNILRSPDVCEKYFEELMIDPREEISPAMVISETLSKFCLQPLQHIGKEMAKLITNFYGTVPVMYHIPATVIFIILLMVFLFYLFGYGIDFPLWMGGIRPMGRPEAANIGEADRITKEAITQLNQDRERFLEESRHILTDITRAAASVVQGQGNFQPLMQMSSGILENQLEHLISRQINFALTQGQGIQQQNCRNTALSPGDDKLDRPLEPDTKIKLRDVSGFPDILTVTSTPLRTSPDNVDGTGGLVGTRDGQNAMENRVGSDSEIRGRSMQVGRAEPRRGIRRGVSSGICEASYEETTSEVEVDMGSTDSRRGAYARSRSCGRVGLPASTDGVHHRIQGVQKREILPPKKSNRNGGSTSSLEEGREDIGLNEKRRKKVLLGKIKKGHSEGYMDDWEGWRARLTRLGRRFHSTNSVDREASPSPCSTNTSTHSLYQDVPPMNESAAAGITTRSGYSDLSESNIIPESPNGTAVSDDFYLQVKILLEESTNSSQNETQIEDASSSLRSIRRRKNCINNDQPEEKELSATGVKFLKSVEKEFNTDD